MNFAVAYPQEDEQRQRLIKHMSEILAVPARREKVEKAESALGGLLDSAAQHRSERDQDLSESSSDG